MSPRAGAARTETRPLRVATYNVHRCIGRDGRRSTARIAAVVRELAADVVLLQEVESGDVRPERQLAALARATASTPLAGPTLWHAEADYGNALLTRHTIVSHRRIDLSVPGREPRGAIDARLRIGPLDVRVVGTHLGLRTAERRYQVTRLLEECRGAARAPGTPLLVVGGDVNEWRPLAGTLRALRTRFGPMPAPRTFPSYRPVLALDRLWVDPAGLVREIRVHRSPLARVASDHLPLVVTIAAQDRSER